MQSAFRPSTRNSTRARGRSDPAWTGPATALRQLKLLAPAGVRADPAARAGPARPHRYPRSRSGPAGRDLGQDTAEFRPHAGQQHRAHLIREYRTGPSVSTTQCLIRGLVHQNQARGGFQRIPAVRPAGRDRSTPETGRRLAGSSPVGLPARLGCSIPDALAGRVPRRPEEGTDRAPRPWPGGPRRCPGRSTSRTPTGGAQRVQYATASRLSAGQCRGLPRAAAFHRVPEKGHATRPCQKIRGVAGRMTRWPGPEVQA